jgi:hypothetical protein
MWVWFCYVTLTHGKISLSINLTNGAVVSDDDLLLIGSNGNVYPVNVLNCDSMCHKNGNKNLSCIPEGKLHVTHYDMKINLPLATKVIISHALINLIFTLGCTCIAW